MSKSRFASSIVASALLLSAGASAAAAAPGSSDPQKTPCQGETYYVVSAPGPAHFKKSSSPYSSVTGGPGVTIAISRSKTFTVGGSITGTVSADAGIILAKVGTSVSIQGSTSWSDNVTVGGSFTVPSTWKVGRLSIGTMGYNGTWKYVQSRPSDCAAITLRGGSYYDIPRDEFHFPSERVS